jgi:predicted Zn-dependent protease
LLWLSPGEMKLLIGSLAALAAALLLVSGFALPQLEPKVYLLPLEAEPELLQSLRAYYQHELALDVEILSSRQLTSATWNKQRRQASAERLVELIYPTHRALGSFAPAIVIGVTGRDMYIENRPWLYAFSYRSGHNLAIVSYARMHPASYGGDNDDTIVETRLRKMVTRNLGVLRFGIALTGNRHDLMYQDILGLDDLDAIEEDLHRAGFPGARPPREPLPHTREVLVLPFDGPAVL